MLKTLGNYVSYVYSCSKSNKVIYRLYLLTTGFTLVIAAIGRGWLGIFHLDPYYTPLEPISTVLTANNINSAPFFGIIFSLLTFPFIMHFALSFLLKTEAYIETLSEWVKYTGMVWILYLVLMLANVLSMQYKANTDPFHHHYLNGNYSAFIGTVHSMYSDPHDANYIISQLNFTKAENEDTTRAILEAQKYMKEHIKSYTQNDRYSSYVLLAFSLRNLKEQQNQEDLLKLKGLFISGILLIIICAFLIKIKPSKHKKD